MNNSKTNSCRLLKTGAVLQRSTLALAVSFGLAQMAGAAESTDSDVLLEELVVSASRVSREGYEAPTPTTVLSDEDISARGLNSVADLLLTVPAFGGSLSPGAQGFSFTSVGQNTVNLRALGANRTLVLVDGKRLVSSATDGTTDLNLIPSIAIQGIDVVTGGASAAYGSDAVTGVVNMTVKNRYEGFEADVRTGVSDESDAEEYKIALLGGTSVMDTRGNVMFALEYAKNTGVGNLLSRDWASRNPEFIQDASGYYNFGEHISTGQFLPNGHIFAGPPFLAGLTFTDDGTAYVPAEFGEQYGNGGRSTQHADEANLNYFTATANLRAPVERYAGLLSFSYDVSDTFRTDLSFNYGKSETDRTTSAFVHVATMYADNAYRPAPGPAVPVGKISDLPPYNLQGGNETWRIALGFEGELSENWSWDAHATIGENTYSRDITNNTDVDKLYLALDAVDDGSGNIVCRSTLTDPTNGCVPLNFFGFGNWSQEAYDYISGSAETEQSLDNQTLAFNIQGDAGSSWAGPISVAAGLEYRSDEVSTKVDDVSKEEGWIIINEEELSGKVSSKEVYVETVVPLLADKAFAKNVDLNAAIRYTDYNISGDVTTWKLGTTWSVNDSLRFRATQSRDIRAPNVAELFQARTGLSNVNTGAGGRQLIPVFRGGSFNLTPEEADTTSFGVSFTPESLPGFHFSVDYFDIEINDAITAIDPATTYRGCLYEDIQELCDLIEFNGEPQDPVTIDNANILIREEFLNSFSLRSRGVDFDLGYGFDAGEGRVNLSLLTTYAAELTVEDFSGAVDFAGVIGQGIAVETVYASPEWISDANIGYEIDRFRANLNIHWVDSGILDPTLSDDQISVNTVESKTFYNLSAQYLIGSADKPIEIYGGIHNLFDEHPPSTIPGPALGATRVAGYYDTVGRRYHVGIRATF